MSLKTRSIPVADAISQSLDAARWLLDQGCEQLIFKYARHSIRRRRAISDRLLSESGMQNHPLTPMTDPDIRRWLQRQTSSDVGGIHLDTVRLGIDGLRAAFAAEAAAGRRLVDDSDLMTIGAAIEDHSKTFHLR